MEKFSLQACLCTRSDQSFGNMSFLLLIPIMVISFCHIQAITPTSLMCILNRSIPFFGLWGWELGRFLQCCRAAPLRGISHHTQVSGGGILEVWSVEVAPGSVADTFLGARQVPGPWSCLWGCRNSCKESWCLLFHALTGNKTEGCGRELLDVKIFMLLLFQDGKPLPSWCFLWQMESQSH